ncbi:MAG: hypoxanthine phosphoribosyltransferase [Chloroflexi bacterium]|nr:hypoxanthine phosphoribosyltransferase [Chloroflexota bacterium]
MTHPYQPYLDEILIDSSAIEQRVRELGEQITVDYTGTGNLLLLCILKGGVMFLTDLMRHIDVPHSIDFMAISSYGGGVRESSGRVRIDMDLRQDIAGKNILIVEDIIDSGHTMQYILSLLETRQPASLRICTLLSKPSRRLVPVPLDYVGFEIPDKFVFGYGLDLDEHFRNLPFVGVCKPGIKFGAG